MRFIGRLLLLAILLLAVAIAAYTYGTRQGSTASRGPSSGDIDTDRMKERGAEIATKAEKIAGEAATKLEAAMTEGALTAKIKSKMALDDLVKARTVNVSTSGTVVTLTGTIASPAERERAVRLASETAGVTRVMDLLEMKP